jgi:CHASE2 domain-containing sensor protein
MPKSFWRDFRKRHAVLFDLAIDVFLGLLIEVIVVPLIYSSPWPVRVVLEGTWAVRNLSDNVADALTRLSATVPASPFRSPPFVFIDIDEPTWRAWGAQLITPRDRLAAVIDVVSQMAPAVVFVDVDLSFPMSRGDSDKRLRRLLRDYGKPGSVSPPLVLIRPLISGGTTSNQAFEERPTAYDDDAVSPNIIWASTLFEEGSDAVVRRWRLVERVCDRGAPKALPSAELALAAIAVGQRASLDESLRKLTPPNCEVGADPERTAPRLDLGHDHFVEFGEGELERRILYSLEWRQPSGSEASRPHFLGPKVEFEGRLVPLVTVLPIVPILSVAVEQTATQKAAEAGLRDLFAGRIVIIGGSFEQSGDIHRTPLGFMPGAMIVINAVHALLSFGTPHELELLPRLALSFTLVVITSLSFHWLRPAVAAIGMGAVLLILMVATLHWFRSGLIVDLAIPAAGVLVHRQFLAISAFVRAIRKDGWRALLAESEEGQS